MDLREQLTEVLGGIYRIERELGGGGMSRVFVAEDTALQRRVVVKVLSPELSAGLDLDRFKRETLLSAKLQHPHIVPVLTAGEVGGLPYFVMPFVSGASLRERLGDGTPLSVNEAVSILRDVARALAYAHDAGVVHRDIKPDNVLLSQGSAAVTDFGIAKAVSSARDDGSGDTLTIAGTSLGTPMYMAPEQIAADPGTDHRADIYSFGIMAYELLAGQPPFAGRPRQMLITAHLTEQPPPLREVVPAVPERLARLVMHCLAKDPAGRPKSAREVIDALDGIEITGVQHVPGRPVGGPALRRALAVAAAILLVIAAGMALARPWGSTSTTLDGRVVAVLPFRVASADPALHYLQEGMMDLLAAKLTGEGGLRATEPRSVLDEWRRGGSNEGRDLSSAQSLAIAQRIGAGLLLHGDVVGTPTRVTLRGSLLRVPAGTELVRVTEEGPPDSLAWLIDRFAARLLSEVAGEGQQRLAGLTSTSLPALRAYLDGQALLRRGDAMNAARTFERALEEDSTFALAGLGLHLATSWYGDARLSSRGLEAAWRERHRLSPRDRVLLDGLAGPRFPAPSSVQEIHQARLRYAQLAPDRAEAQYLVGDHIYHYGRILGIVHPARTAYEYFIKASELDSTYVVGFAHAHSLAVQFGDSTQERRLLRLRLAADTASWWYSIHRWYTLARAGDRAAAEAMRDSLGDEYSSLASGMVQHALHDGTGAGDAWQELNRMFEGMTDPATRAFVRRQLADVAMIFGKPATAARLYDEAFAGDTVNLDILRIRNAMAGGADAEIARMASRRLSAFDAAPISADTTVRPFQRAVIRALEPWRIAEGDTTNTRRSLTRLRTIARLDGQEGLVERQTEIALIEAMHAHVTRAPNAGALVNRLDSLLQVVPYYDPTLHHGRVSFANIVLARLYEERGDPRRALAAIRRRAEGMGGTQPYLSTQLRDEGRLAEAAGEQEIALRAYRHYLALNFDPEPGAIAGVRAARDALARLERAAGS